eukprot:scaffold35820_cov65-Phaeocystis_antarctica.AAC.8
MDGDRRTEPGLLFRPRLRRPAVPARGPRPERPFLWHVCRRVLRAQGADRQAAALSDSSGRFTWVANTRKRNPGSRQ